MWDTGRFFFALAALYAILYVMYLSGALHGAPPRPPPAAGATGGSVVATTDGGGRVLPAVPVLRLRGTRHMPCWEWCLYKMHVGNGAMNHAPPTVFFLPLN